MLIWAERLLWLPAVLLWLGALRSFFRLRQRPRGPDPWLAGLLWVSWALILLSEAWRWLLLGHWPVASYFDSLTLFIFIFLTFYLLLQSRMSWPVLAVVTLPLMALGLTGALFLPRVAHNFEPFVKNTWLGMHATLNFMAYGGFALSFLVGVLYLYQERQLKRKRFTSWYHLIPSLESLDMVGGRLIAWAFPLLSFGIVTGAIYAQVAWGSYWNWNPKETWSLITWLIYLAYLAARGLAGWRGRKATLLAVFGFAAVLVNYFGVNLLWQSPHALTTPW